MKKFAFLFVLVLSFFLLSFTPAKATALLVIDNDGGVIWKVLSSQDSISLGIPQREFLEIKNIAVTNTSSDTKITLEKDGENINLNVATNEGEKSLDVTSWQDDLIEIEERGETQRVTIRVLGEEFSIEQKGISAVTSYPININPNKNEISVLTPSGTRFLSILPIEAAESALRAKTMNRLTNQKIALVEGEKRELIYIIKGERLLNIFNLLEYPIEVETQVSALTGEIVQVEQPVWLKVLGFLFT